MDFARWLSRQDIHEHIEALSDELHWKYDDLRRLIMSDFQTLETQVHAITQAVRDAADRVNAEIAALVASNPNLAPDIAELQAAVSDLNQIGQGNVSAPAPAPDPTPTPEEPPVADPGTTPGF